MRPSLPTERLVLAFGVVLAACAYAYWLWRGRSLGVPWAGVAAVRAGVALGGVALLAVVLRLAARVNRPPDDGRPGGE